MYGFVILTKLLVFIPYFPQDVKSYFFETARFLFPSTQRHGVWYALQPFQISKVNHFIIIVGTSEEFCLVPGTTFPFVRSNIPYQRPDPA